MTWNWAKYIKSILKTNENRNNNSRYALKMEVKLLISRSFEENYYQKNLYETLAEISYILGMISTYTLKSRLLFKFTVLSCQTI